MNRIRSRRLRRELVLHAVRKAAHGVTVPELCRDLHEPYDVIAEIVAAFVAGGQLKRRGQRPACIGGLPTSIYTYAQEAQECRNNFR